MSQKPSTSCFQCGKNKTPIFATLLCFQERIARFVSMIPFVSDSAAFPDLCDIWSTSEVGTTSKKEQAVGNGSQNKKVSFLFYLW